MLTAELPTWEEFTRCDYVTCDNSRKWETTWKRTDEFGNVRTEKTRECSSHALDTKWDRHLGKPIAITAL